MKEIMPCTEERSGHIRLGEIICHCPEQYLPHVIEGELVSLCKFKYSNSAFVKCGPWVWTYMSCTSIMSMISQKH